MQMTRPHLITSLLAGLFAFALDRGHKVLQVSSESSASLIVVGVRPRSPVGKLLLGSVAQRIILDATCPVLAVKPDGAEGLA